ncbi:MAG: site-specific integrase [Micavibrio sp.]|nr:site-specific integrase [Micavibrio sp.]
MASIEERTNSKGDKSYRAKVRLKGYPVQSATFKRKTDATRWIASTESAIREGRHFKTSEAKRRTLSEAIERYRKEILPRKPKSMKKQSLQLTWWDKQLGQYSLADITTSVISEARSTLLNESLGNNRTRSEATANRYMAVLSHLLNVASKEWEWISENPCSRISKLPESRGRVRFLSDVERAALLGACKESKSSHLYPVVVIALSTGARLGEILGLRWQDVDTNKGRITIQETKNGERRTVPLTHHALDVVKEWSKVRRIDSELLFPTKRNPKTHIDIRSPWYTAVKRARIEDFRFHDLRHCAASYLAMNGATLAEIAEVLGHKTLQMVKRYAHLSEAHTHDVVAKMNDRIFNQ